MNNKNHIFIWVLVVVAVIVLLVFLTISGKQEDASFQKNISNENTSINMEQSIQDIDGGKVKVTITKEGAGEVAKTGDVVAVNYTGKFTDGKAFDSNVLPEFGHVEPFAFQLGAGMVIKGWDVGVAGMKIGEKRMLEIAPEYAYGERGAGGVIPPNSTLVFEVELISIVNNK